VGKEVGGNLGQSIGDVTKKLIPQLKGLKKLSEIECISFF
jgi:hypothetical protein